ncbi:MAG TPA: sialidase family protein [Saprospiraceae bacterium]|nr:sialidase family protein [Saprospiraceae bacterium]HPN68102.1 sialidase family protein [Saprospiraceae bacterium]
MKNTLRNKGLASLSLLVLGFSLSCSPKNKILLQQNKVVVNITIDEGQGSFAPCEPSISISPVNPNLVTAGSVLNNVYHSEDAGKTWRKEILKSSFGVYGDPVVRYDGLGNVYYAHLSNPKNKAYSSEEFLDRIVVQKLSNSSNTWSNGTFPLADKKKDHDKQWIVVNPIDQSLTMTWTQFDKYGSKLERDKTNVLFSISKDQGETWSESIIINEVSGDCVDDDLTNEGAFTAVGIDGSIMAVWARDSKIWFDRSTDGGKNWLKSDKAIADQIGGWSMDIPGIDRTNGFPILKVDHSNGKYRGRVYMSWTDQRNGSDNTDVWIIHSDDHGQHWSQAIKVNNDSGKAAHQFFHSMDLDQSSGYVYLLFYDRRNYQDAHNDVYLAYTTNGGKDFVNTKVSETSFLSEKIVFFGDYTDISAVQGKVRPIWTHQEGKVLKIKTALIDIGI